MALILTNPSAILLRAEDTILENVGLDILSLFAASTCFNPSRSASLMASNSSSVRYTPFSLLRGLHIGLKHLSPGKHFIHLVFFGRKIISFSYEHMLITSISHCIFMSINNFVNGWTILAVFPLMRAVKFDEGATSL